MDQLLICLLLVLAISPLTFSHDTTLESKVQKLNKLTAHTPMINIDNDIYRLYVQQPPRNYSVFLLLTTLSPKHDCQACKLAVDEFQIVANSWYYSKQRDSSIYFCMADFDRAPDVFTTLNKNMVPVIIHMPPSGASLKLEQMDLERTGLSAEGIVAWIASRIGTNIKLFRPPSYTGTMLVAFCMIVAAFTFWFGQFSVDFIYNSKLWCILTMGVVFYAISGQVYNQIRGPPLLHVTQQGEIKAFVFEGSDYQFVVETLIVLALYIASTAGILLINQVDAEDSAKRKKLFLCTGLVLFSVAFSLLLSLFRKKYRGYPYRFLFG